MNWYKYTQFQLDLNLYIDFISPDIIVGPAPEGFNESTIDVFVKNDVGGVLNLESWFDAIGEKSFMENHGIEYKFINIKFAPDIFQIKEATRYIDKIIGSGKKIYIHCSAGETRSPFMIILYKTHLCQL